MWLTQQAQITLARKTLHESRRDKTMSNFVFVLDTNKQPVRKSALRKSVKGFQTGDIIRAVVTKGKKIGFYLGKVAIRCSSSFNIKTVTKTVQGISHKYC